MDTYKKFLFFDIETTGKYDSFKSFLEEDPRGALTFEKKWNRMKFNNTQNNNWNCDIERAWRNNSPLMAEFGLIVCLSYGFVNPKTDKMIVKSVFIKDNNETELLKKIAEIFNKISELFLIPTGHNIKGFDVPYIVKKMMMHGIKIPGPLYTYNKKPWEVSLIDTAEVWKGLAWENTSLDEITYALNVPSPKDNLDGAHVFEMYWDIGDIQQIVEYCEKDVFALYDICEKIYKTL